MSNSTSVNSTESLINRDNLWNLTFASLMSLGMVMGEYSLISPLLAIICVPLLTKLVQNVTFDKEHGFFSKDGLSINEIDPKNVKTSLILAGGIAFLLNFFEAKSELIWISLFFIPTFFFIKNNCPISILFNKGFYKEPIIRPMTDEEIKDYHSHSIGRRIYHPSYRYKPMNIHKSSPF